MKTLQVSPDLLERLNAPRWAAASLAEQREVAAELTRRLREGGMKCSKPIERPCGPPEEERLAFDWDDQASDLPFTLVPGGRFHPGLSPQALSRFEALQRRKTAWMDERPEHEVPYQARGWTPAALRARPETTAEPMLVATFPVLQELPGVADVIDVRANRLLGFKEQPGRALHVLPEELSPLLARYAWDLPTSEELEWIGGAGRDELFYWGDDLPKLLVEDYVEAAAEDFAAEVLEVGSDRWPAANRFGIAGLVAYPQWCGAAAASGSLVVRGGAGAYYPWQACGEWLWMLNALAIPATEVSADFGCAVRPVIRLRA